MLGQTEEQQVDTEEKTETFSQTGEGAEENSGSDGGEDEAVVSTADVPGNPEELRYPQTTEHVRNSTATVKVVLVPEGHVMTVAFSIGLSIQELKRHLASELRVPAEVLRISLDGRVVEEQQSLMELGIQPHSSTPMEMMSTDPDAHPLRPLRPPEHDSMPDVITVRVQSDDRVFQEVVVEIERPRQQKPFLGGYRHRLTGVEYHHAAVQPLPKRRPDRGVEVFNRDTQTVVLKSQAQQCPVSVGTQMTKSGCFVSPVNDRVVVAGQYVTAEEYHDRRLKAVVRLQACIRGWQSRQKVERLRRERERRLAWMDMQERRRKEEKEEQLRDHHRRQMNPQTSEDFKLLYHALENWRSEEEERINSDFRGAERKAALCSLLEQELDLIASIGRHRIVVQKNHYSESIRKFLDKSAAPHQWITADGRPIEMDTPFTIRARELRDLYNTVTQTGISHEERFHILMTLKCTVKEHACQLTRDIVDLIDREVHLMELGIKAVKLVGLRQRISTLFLQFIKTPAFNPEVAKLLKVPQDPSKLKSDMIRCRSCQRYLRSADFLSSASGKLSSRCLGCARLDSIARSREDFSSFRNILRRLRASELELNVEAKIPSLLEVEDVQYLVEVVWQSRSALNASSSLTDLVLVRWEQHKDWSPWNCILLCEEELPGHMEVEDVHKAYEATFVLRVEHKHLLARQHFSKIPVMAEYLHSQAAAAIGDLVIPKPIAMVTD